MGRPLFAGRLIPYLMIFRRLFMSELNFYLLQINDALFPIGAYSHSQGLETYIQRGIVHDEATAKEYIHHKIRWNL